MPTQTNIEGKRILVVDDEVDVLDSVIGLLSMCRVDSARTFDEARDKLENNFYDIVILDIMGVDGFQLLKIARRKELLTIMLTAHALSPMNIAKSFYEGAVSFIPKEKMVELPTLLSEIWETAEKRKDALWNLWVDQFDSFLEKRFGPEWKQKVDKNPPEEG